MGHLRLSRLPASKQWTQVVELLTAGGSIAELADATALAAESEFDAAAGDPVLGHVVWLLSQLPLAARSEQFAARLGGLGFEAGADRSLHDLIAGFSVAVDRHGIGKTNRTDLGELARSAAVESLAATIGPKLPSLFSARAVDLKSELAKLATKDQFASLARDFFSRLTLKTLDYYISRELPNHVGAGRALTSIDQQIAFRGALEQHCREASLIVQAFAGGWYSKANFKGDITLQQAQAFTDYALKKMRAELHVRRER
jgi:hypothetical protein